MIPTGGDGSAFVKYDGAGGIQIGAGGQTFTVRPEGTTVSNDFNPLAGGMVRSYEYRSLRLLQNVTPLMTASVLQFSGTAALGNGNTTFYTKVGTRRAGSIVGLMLYCEDATLSAGALTGNILVDGAFPTTQAQVIVGSGNTKSFVNFAKDTYVFSTGSLLTVQLSSSADMQCVAAGISGSWTMVVDVEY